MATEETKNSPAPVAHATANVKYPFWYGGASSMVACLCTHPLDLAKVRLQTAHKRGGSLASMMMNIIKNEGPLAIYSGLSASLLRQATYSTTRFGIYEYLKESFANPDGSQPGTAILLPCSMLAGAIGGLVGNPADVINIRMQNDSSLPVEKRRNYKNAFDGLIRIPKEEKFGALFRGLTPNLTRGVLMTASQVASYDVAKEFLIDTVGFDEHKKTTHFSASLIAGLIATTVCSPADVVKTRIMHSHGEGEGAISILVNSVKHEGIGFMFRGWLPAFFRLGPQTIITFLVLEQFRNYRVGM